jgi:hypothetical protein
MSFVSPRIVRDHIVLAEAEWVALSDKGTLTARGMANASLDRGVFVMELTLPLQGSTVLLDHQQHGHTGHSVGVAKSFATSCRARCRAPMVQGGSRFALTLRRTAGI